MSLRLSLLLAAASLSGSLHAHPGHHGPRHGGGHHGGGHHGGGYPDRGHPGHGDAIEVICESHDYRYQECYAGEGLRYTDVYLVDEFSDTECRRGRNWGTRGSYIWVDHGCRGVFEIRFGHGYPEDRVDIEIPRRGGRRGH